MKHLKKYLALLMAGLIVASSLAACGGSDSSDDDDDDDDGGKVTTTASDEATATAQGPTPPVSSDAPTTTTQAPATTTQAPATSGAPETGMLSPSALFAKLVSAPNATVTVVSETDLLTVTTTTRHSGDVVRDVSDYSGYTSSSYYDLGENLYYFYDSDEELWYVSEGDGETWEDLVDYMGFESSLDDDCFEEKDGGWIITDEALQDMKEEEEMDGELSVTYTLEDGVYTYTMEVKGDSVFGDMKAYFSISFEELILVLPEDAVPYVEEDYSDSEYANLDPSELYDAIAGAEDIIISVVSDEVYTQYEKDGDLVKIFSGADAFNGTTVYIDFAGDVRYFTDASGAWTSEAYKDYDSWTSMLAAMSITADLYMFRDDYYDPFTDEDETLSIKDELLAGGEFDWIDLDRYGISYTLSESYLDGRFYSTNFLFEETELELPA